MLFIYFFKEIKIVINFEYVFIFNLLTFFISIKTLVSNCIHTSYFYNWQNVENKSMVSFWKTYSHRSFQRTNTVEILKQCQTPLREEMTNDLESPNNTTLQCNLPSKMVACSNWTNSQEVISKRIIPK